MEYYLDAQEVQGGITMVQSASLHVNEATLGLVLKQEDVNTMELGVDKTLIAKVRQHFTFMLTLFIDYY